MNDNGQLNLRESLLIADSILQQSAMSLMMGGVNEDPFGLNLPPIVGNSSSSLTPNAETLKVLATLYQQAELEQAGIIPVADVLAEARYRLSVQSFRSSNLLEQYYQKTSYPPEANSGGKRGVWLDRNSREHVFARVFGFNLSNAASKSVSSNRDFQTKFANFCLELRNSGEDLRWRKQVSPMRDSALRQAILDLLVNLGSRSYGDTYAAARRIQSQIAKAVELLSDEGIGNVFQARGMWQLLDKLLKPDTPDFGRLTTRGQSGMRLLIWLVGILPQIEKRDLRKPVLEATSPAVNWAEMWLRATGFDRRKRPSRRVA